MKFERSTYFEVAQVGGIPFQVSTLEAAAVWLVDIASKERLAVNVRLANAFNVALAAEDPEYRQLLRDEGINFPDGTPVVWFMNRWLKKQKSSTKNLTAGRVRGPSLFTKTVQQGESRGIRHFLLGSTPETLNALAAELRRLHPEIAIAGVYSPPFAPVDDAYVNDCANQVQAADADIVWVGLGTPKQDYLGTQLAKKSQVTTVNVGAAFDFTAGTVREAPVWIQNSGFEWLYRLASEPRRLWKRYVFGNARFLLSAWRHRNLQP